MIHIRVCGRTLRPGDLESRRFFLGTLGVESLKVPRSQNPYAVARRIRRHLKADDVSSLKQLALGRRSPAPPITPDVENPEFEEHAAAAE